MRSSRAFVSLLVLTAVVAALLGDASGVESVLLYAAPALLVIGLLLNGRFVGEDRILALRKSRAPERRPALRADWPAHRARPLASLLERSPRSLRGPPALHLA